MTQRTAPRPGRPVWVITIFYLFSALFALLSLLLLFSGAVPVPPEEGGDYLGSLTVFDHLLSAATAVLTLAAVVALFMLRRAAFYLFCAVLQVLNAIWQAATTGFVAAAGGSGLVGYLIGLAILAAVCAYCRRLLATGVLR